MSEQEEIGRYVHILSRQIKRKIDEVVAKYDVTSVQCAILGYIYEASRDKEVYAKDIENKFNMRRATVAEILSLMEKNGLIDRMANKQDARLKKIILKEKSLEIKNKVKEEISKVEKEIQQGISKEEMDIFKKVIQKMSKNI